MPDLNNIRDSYINDGLAYEQAEVKAAQDVILDLIARSSMTHNITIKGGVLMQHVSKSMRRATSDFDLDFVRYPIKDESIRQFVRILNEGESEFTIKLIGPIEELKHQDYSGKRIYVRLGDSKGSAISTKIDIGVHTLVSPELDELCFDLAKLDKVVTLLADSSEQVVAEKLKSLLKIGAASTRYKDVFDIYYHLVVKTPRRESLNLALTALIFNDEKMRENDYADIAKRLQQIFGNRRFIKELSRAKNNWLDVPPKKVTSEILDFFKRY